VNKSCCFTSNCIAQQETAILSQAWQQQNLLELKDKRLQQEIEKLNRKIQDEKKRDSIVQTETANKLNYSLSSMYIVAINRTDR
jgi:Txe/YoeB family toxin of Txe-Axe toxin-antitoxin module